ncbi:hypothetical protein C8Q80DRAFT_1164789 [Daedaleopsis nitida]|nr:hypothetical protein C8Q80DRAFT_1164789 [Daedaleopsis nitida]
MGVFDLVHVNLLFLCLTEAGRDRALNNIRQVMKLGGFILIEEGDPVLYSCVEAPPERTEEDFARQMANAGWLGLTNRLYTGRSLECGFYPDHLSASISAVRCRDEDDSNGAALGWALPVHPGMHRLGPVWLCGVHAGNSSSSVPARH